MAEASGKPARWPFKFSEFKLDIVYRARINHQEADTLSCLMINSEDRTSQDNEI